MSREHPGDDILTAFVLGDLSTEVGVRVAHHLDGCPQCAARAASLDPLTHAFAAVEDPELPEGFVAAVLEKDARERGGAVHDLRHEPLVAVALLAASALVFLGLGQPEAVVSSVVSTAHLAGTLGPPLAAMVDAATLAWSVLGVCAFVAAVVVAQRRGRQEPW